MGFLRIQAGFYDVNFKYILLELFFEGVGMSELHGDLIFYYHFDISKKRI